MSLTVNKLGMDMAKSFAGVMISNELDISSKLNLGDSFIMRNGSSGLIYAGISDVINYFTTNRSKALNGDFIGLADDTAFFSALSAGAELTQVDTELLKTLNKVTPFGNKMNGILVESAIITGGRFFGDYILATPSAPQYLKMLRKPSKAMGK